MQKPPSRFILPGGSFSFRQPAVSSTMSAAQQLDNLSATHLLRQLPAANQQWAPEPLPCDCLLQRKQQLVRCSVQSQTELFKGEDRRGDFPTDNSAEIFGANVTIFRGESTTEALFSTNAAKRGRQVFRKRQGSRRGKTARKVVKSIFGKQKLVRRNV